jgi:hypothetical protein
MRTGAGAAVPPLLRAGHFQGKREMTFQQKISDLLYQGLDHVGPAVVTNVAIAALADFIRNEAGAFAPERGEEAADLLRATVLAHEDD